MTDPTVEWGRPRTCMSSGCLPAALDRLPSERLIHRGQPYQAVDHGSQDVLVAKCTGSREGRDQVEVRDGDQAPVQATNHEKDRCQGVERFHCTFPRMNCQKLIRKPAVTGHTQAELVESSFSLVK